MTPLARAKRKRGAETAARAATTTGATASAPKLPAVTVRHYCEGIGDCHLLTFRGDDGSPFRILIDCGVHSSTTGGTDLVRDIVADLAAETGRKIDVLVVTHEHWDHVSGFLTAGDLFKDFSVGEVWMGWTEDPEDSDAIALDRFKGEALAALQGAALRLDGVRSASAYVGGLREGLQAVLGFQFGAAGERVRAARDAAARLSAGKPPRYLEPATAPFSLAGLPNLRIYVLGPPRSRTALRTEEKASEMYALAGSAAGPLLKALGAGLAADGRGVGAPADGTGPFDPDVGSDLSAILAGGAQGGIADFVERHYRGPLPPKEKTAIDDAVARDQSWRRIDLDWMGIAADLAMQLDRGVNNTSLVLAFEMLDTGRIFLFPGDAQIGSWLSWQDLKWEVNAREVTAEDLLGRTVYLKVAHHGSRNATPEAHGLGMMASPDLSAFIPTNKKDAMKVHWGEMPYHGILDALLARTAGRTVRADDEWLAVNAGKPAFDVPSGSIKAVRHKPRATVRGEGGLWIELDLA